jgi:hypothetical protein
MLGYIGKYRIEGQDFVTHVDASWNQEWNGTEQRRHFRIEGDKLFIEPARAPSIVFPGKADYRRIVWEKEKWRARNSISRILCEAAAGGPSMITRRAFLGSHLGAVAFASTQAPRTGERKAALPALEPLVWPLVDRGQSGVRSFSGHTNTVLDVVGRIGVPPSLVIFTEGNHLMALLSEEIIGAFPAWARMRSQYSALNLDNAVVVTMPQPSVVQIVRTGRVAFGNLTLEVSRASGLYPDIVMGGLAPLQELRKLGVVEAQARYFSRNRGRAMVARKGNPLRIRSLADVARRSGSVPGQDCFRPRH